MRVREWSVEMKVMDHFKSVFFIFVVNVEYRYPSFLLIVAGYGVNVEKLIGGKHCARKTKNVRI